MIGTGVAIEPALFRPRGSSGGEAPAAGPGGGKFSGSGNGAGTDSRAEIAAGGDPGVGSTPSRPPGTGPGPAVGGRSSVDVVEVPTPMPSGTGGLPLPRGLEPAVA